MGGLFSSSIANNYASEMVQSMINVSNSATQTCQIANSQIQNASISGVSGGSVTVNADWKNQLVLNYECLQSTKFSNQLGQTINQEAKQLAKAINQQFALGEAEASNTVKLSAQLGITVSNAFTQECLAYNSQIQNISYGTATNTTAVLNLNWENYNASSFKCVMQNQSVTNVTQQISQEISQSATATIENWLAGIIGAIAAVIGAIALIIFAAIFFLSLSKSKGPQQAPTNITVPNQGSSNSGLSAAEIAALLK